MAPTLGSNFHRRRVATLLHFDDLPFLGIQIRKIGRSWLRGALYE